MKKIIILLTLAYGICAQAGAQLDIPAELMDLDNQGRSMFIKNALTNIGVTTGSYENLQSIIIGGESTAHEEKKGAYILYLATLGTSVGVYKCEQRLVLGVFVEERPDLVGADPVVCKL
ncbi:MAG: hypothetical protein ACXWC9_08775 [Pseudobdellovibrionaceae bacterium]